MGLYWLRVFRILYSNHFTCNLKLFHTELIAANVGYLKAETTPFCSNFKGAQSASHIPSIVLPQELRIDFINPGSLKT